MTPPKFDGRRRRCRRRDGCGGLSRAGVSRRAVCVAALRAAARHCGSRRADRHSAGHPRRRDQCRPRRLGSRSHVRHDRRGLVAVRPGDVRVLHADRRQRRLSSALSGRAGQPALFRTGEGRISPSRRSRASAARTRHHVRFWKALDSGDDGRPVWLGAASFDDKVGISHYTGQITHHIAPDIDGERDFLIQDLVEAKRVDRTYSVSGIGPTLFGRNGGGDPFYTDGEIAFADLAPGCETREAPPETQATLPRIAAKNVVYGWLAAARRLLPER